MAQLITTWFIVGIAIFVYVLFVGVMAFHKDTVRKAIKTAVIWLGIPILAAVVLFYSALIFAGG